MRCPPSAAFAEGIVPVAPTGTVTAATDPLRRLDALRRAPLLVQAARFGLADHQRPVALRRLLGRVPPPGPGVLAALLDLEQAHQDARAAGAATWRAAEHVEALIAVMAEGRLLAALRRDG